jgi:hypothetical protein
MNSANIKLMTDSQLIKYVAHLVQREREIVECLIWHLQEVQDRKLFIQMGYTSMFECLVKHFKYSEPVAYSRISALRIISEVPAVADALNSGEVNLTTLTMAQSFIRKQEKESGEKISIEMKTQYIESIKNKSTAEVKQILATLNPIAELPLDRVQYLDMDHVQLQVTADRNLLEKIEHLKSLISHENLNPSFNEIFNLALDAAIEKVEKRKGLRAPVLKAKVLFRNNSDDSKVRKPRGNLTQSFAIKNSRYIPRNVKRFVVARSQNRCEHIHSDGRRCSSKFQTQFDHIKAHSKGGNTALENMQLLCRVHNHKGSA